MNRVALLAVVVGIGWGGLAQAEEPKPLKILFLGDEGHHRPLDRYRQLQPVMAARKIEIIYTDKADALLPKNLDNYDGVIVYANIDQMTPAQEASLLDFVARGKGFIPLHCASFCFRNSEKYVALVGAQFQRHGTGVFRVTPSEPNHPVVKGFGGFESWDETYVHSKHNEKDRTVLEYRVEGDQKEPWTWVRTHGKGRVFYTAWGHDNRTWSHLGFQNLIERGIRWACGQDVSTVPNFRDQPTITGPQKDTKPFEYVEANVPFYPPSEKRGTPTDVGKKMQKPVSPAESMKHAAYPSDFDLKLFASEELLGGKPLCMNWDERGRLWVAITLDYPNEMQPEGKGRDRIVIVEDTNNDGVGDKVTTFADKLSIVTSLLPFNGNVIVHQAPKTLLLQDTDGDGKADQTKVLLNGWATNDTHAGPSNLRYGLDGWIYGMVGYAGFNGEVGGVRHSFRQGFYRFKADGSALEFLRSTNNNSWGVGFTEDGLLFGSTANGCPSVYLPIPNRYYERVRGFTSSVLQNIAQSNQIYPITKKVRQVDWHNGFTAAAGSAIYTARNYPQEYWNRTAFISEPTGHLTATFQLLPNGTDFSARYGWNLFASQDEWSAPISAEVGPDGNVWLIDWYNFIVQHNPTPVGFKNGKGNAYETELRDKKHGRIYRLVPKQTKTTTMPVLQSAKTEDLVQALKSDNMFWRLHAQRALTERGAKDAIPALVKLLEDPSVDGIGLNPTVIHALWTLRNLGATQDKTVQAAVRATLRHTSAGVRRNAVLVLQNDVEAALSSLNDTDPQVRLATLLHLADAEPDSRVGAPLLAMLVKPENHQDRWLYDAGIAAAAAHDLHFLKAVSSHNGTLPVRVLTIVGIVADHHGRRGAKETIGELLQVLTETKSNGLDAIITGLGNGWPKNQKVALDEKTEQALAKLLVQTPASSRGYLLKFAATLGSVTFQKQAAEVAKSLVVVISDEKQSDEKRSAAAKQVMEFLPEDGKVIATLLDAITPRTSPSLANALIEAVGTSSNPAAGTALLKGLKDWSPGVRTVAIRAILARPDSTSAYLDSVEAGAVTFDELALDQKQALTAHPDTKIASRAKALLSKGGSLPSPDRQKVIDELVAVTKKSGDPVLGKAMFTKHCSGCHMHSGTGTKVGPDLTGMAVHPKLELLTHIMDPNRSVEGNYRIYNVTTLSGKVLSGLLASETKTSIELIDTQAKKIVLLRDDIETIRASNKSLMPDGFEKQMNADELTNLLEFLTQRGKFLPLPLDKAATVVSTKGMFFEKESEIERFILKDWAPRVIEGVPFILIDPQGDKNPNVIMLNSRNGKIPPTMPKSVTLPCNSQVKTIHLLSGVSGWGFPGGTKGSVTLIVRLKYEDGKTEDHALKNGEHFADYIRRIDVPDSKFVIAARSQQIRYLAIHPKRPDKIATIELVKGPDACAPLIFGITLEGQ